MGLEGAFSQEEKKRKKIQEKIQISEKFLNTTKRNKEEISKREKTEKDLFFLREAIVSGKIDTASIEQVEDFARDAFLDTQEFHDICEMIEAIEQDVQKNHYIPESMRISQTQYKEAFYSLSQRQDILIKIDTILGILLQHISPGSMRSLNMLGSIALLLDKDLIFVQEAHIDMKRSLQDTGKIPSKKRIFGDFFSFFHKN